VTVKEIIDNVRTNGDLALLDYTLKFDGHNDILISEKRIKRSQDQMLITVL